MANRLRQIREEKNLTQEYVARKANTSSQQIGKLEKDERRLTVDWLIRLSPALGCSPVEVVPELLGGLQLPPKDDRTVHVAIINATACCGNGIENETENVVGFWQIPRDEYRAITTAAPEHVKMLRVFGDSMEGTLSDGDWVLVDISRNYIDGDGLFLIRMTSGLAVKRIQNSIGGKIVIKSDNKKYDNIESSAEEIPVIGKVIYTLKAEKVG